MLALELHVSALQELEAGVRLLLEAHVHLRGAGGTFCGGDLGRGEPRSATAAAEADHPFSAEQDDLPPDVAQAIEWLQSVSQLEPASRLEEPWPVRVKTKIDSAEHWTFINAKF